MGVLSAWLVAAGIITWRDLHDATDTHNVHGLPLPADYVATFIVFGTLGAIAQAPSAKTFATITAWGFVIAAAINLYDPTDPLGTAKKKTTKGAKS